MESSTGNKFGKVQVDVIEHTVRSLDQTTIRKVPQGNGTLIPAFESTVNPSLGDVYNFKFRAIQEAMKTRETNI